ncbi:killer cell lectin-like receptor subfamily F member 1 [Emydura macquarii macquarii]|uniref:killer cell lectin-like receptor subfamily F member 1 n=1 Tax=Emydura macquarii macquarii TaxID=1129001 RepID=UPI00352BB1ED
MEDEEGYAVLNRQPKQRQPGHPSGAGAQVSQLQTRGALNTAEKNETRIVNSTECSSHLEDFRSRLKPILCEPHHGSLAEGSGCKLCPRDWQLYGDNCYWLSKERKAWTGSHEDCSQKSSHMLVIQTQEEMDFIQDVIRGESYVWIGLNMTPPRGTWTWVDGSPLDPARFSVSGPAEGNRCGRLKDTQIQSDVCGSELQWICQKEAAMI